MSTSTVQGRSTSRPAFGARYRRFRPRLVLGYQQDLNSLIGELTAMRAPEAGAALDSAIATLDERQSALRSFGLTGMDVVPTVRYGATLRVLRDLISQGWTIREDDEGIILDAPGRTAVRLDDPEAAKESIRRSFAFARDAQLREPSTLEFIATMERRGIERLFTSGAELASRLTTQGTTGVRPELQVIEPGGRDETTGVRLQDVWRYARHFWSIPYQSTPGRNLFYLVRDGTLPERPLIGIAALGNPVLGLAKRDDHFGWSANGLERRLADMTARKRRSLAGHLVQVLADGVKTTYSDDLRIPADPLRSAPATVAALEEIERRSAADRLAKLDAAGEARDADYLLIRAAHNVVDHGEVDSVDWERVARTALYRRKRAGALADLYRALATLTDLGFTERGGDLQSALAEPEGRRAIETALRRIKQDALASNVMELITCGAVPPYRGILGGKLVALLMLSRQVAADVEDRYGDRVSIIASAIAGRPVRRPAKLALVTTSSLYEAYGSSQYNRLKVETDRGALAYRKIARTESFGTVQFAPDTVQALNDVARHSESYRREVNNLFGEGTSPKLRQIRTGLEALGLDADSFLRHNSRRIIFGVPLCTNIDDVVLRMSTRPRYLLSPGDEGTAVLIGYWRDRWLAGRITRPDVLEALRGEEFEGFRLSRESERLASGSSGGGRSGRRTAGVSTGVEFVPIAASEVAGDQTFIERLYRSSNSYADRLTAEELDSIHVDLGVDDYVVAEAEAGRQIIVTGNPGDGKTHLIERLRPKLTALGARVITDANAFSDGEILDQWAASRGDGKPFVLAINEWPLYVLQRHASITGFTPVAEALRQVTSARFFVEKDRPDDAKDNVMVVDLSLRNLLSADVVGRVIDRLTQDRFFAGLNEADPAIANRDALRETQVRERLLALLELVATRTGHITMRQLVGFVAFLITGGQSATDRVRAGQDALASAYFNLAFEGGVGALFDAVRNVFDPAEVTHPDWDERLWLGDTDARDWLGRPPPGPMTLNESERDGAYRAIKRRFFFEHKSGMELVGLVPTDEQEFQETLRSGEGATATVVRDLVLALNRFFEPDCPDSDKDHIQLWQSHRYDVRAPSTFVSFQALSYQNLRIEALKIAPWVEVWLPAEQLDRRSFALVATWEGKDIAVIEIDRDLFLTLIEAERGLGRSSWSRTATRRITRFIDRVHGAIERESPIEDIRIRNVESDLDERFAIQREPAGYQL
ncbi:MAG TPA: Druantia anti-phage system protein DruA [Solirubrobacteraceae bacterium]|nr:Druantia anti-phage system protein DruA [Solirubrobacteraceae bacterium]